MTSKRINPKTPSLLVPIRESNGLIAHHLLLLVHLLPPYPLQFHHRKDHHHHPLDHHHPLFHRHLPNYLRLPLHLRKEPRIRLALQRKLELAHDVMSRESISMLLAPQV
jgi:hypothetical protein